MKRDPISLPLDLGNSVFPPVVAAIIGANFVHEKQIAGAAA